MLDYQHRNNFIMKKSFLQRGILVVTLVFGLSVSLSSCIGEWLFGPEKQYPHYITEFIEPTNFELKAEYGNTSNPERLCRITLTDRGKDRVTIFNYDGRNPKIINFLVTIGDTHYPNRTNYERRSRGAKGVVTVPTDLAVTCDHDYSKELKAGSLLNEVMYIRYLDHLSFVKGGYKGRSSAAIVSLKAPDLYKRLLASNPEWYLMMEKHPEAWNGETVRFTITMVVTLTKGKKTVSNSVDVKFPEAGK